MKANKPGGDFVSLVSIFRLSKCVDGPRNYKPNSSYVNDVQKGKSHKWPNWLLARLYKMASEW